MFRYCLLLVLLTARQVGFAQVDTEFWFAPPEVTAGHGDRPIYLRISTLDKAALVTVTQPGRGNVTIASANVPANTTQTLDLTNEIANLETIIPAFVMKTGIRIISSAPVTAYYEIGAAWNSDIFTLKGKNALGNKFVIPGQNFYDNSGDYYPNPSSSFDIVASQNNTVVKVFPTKPIVGHEGDSVITVKLNAGETYSFRKTTLWAAANPIGTVVESNKPIAITLKDDSVINGGCRDILGDQLVPVEVAGTEYVVLKGFLSTPEYLFITATEDDTEIFIGGSATPASVLSKGQIYRHMATAKSTYISASKTIYVFHVTGFGCEMGMAILPSITCKGSPQIGFSRTTDEFFGLNVLIRKEGIGSFTLNGSSALIPATAFTPVPGTDDKWYTAQLSFSTSQIPVGQASLIRNSRNSFQIGIINGNAATTCRYGYFSSFSTLFIGDDVTICEGQTTTLDAGPDKESYLWSNGDTSQNITVSTPGDYWVKVEREECILYDTVKVTVRQGQLDIGPDIQICPGVTAYVDGKENFSWQWSDGSTGQALSTTAPGKYWVTVHDYTGCVVSDTVIISEKAHPVADLGPAVVKCKEEELTLDASFPGATYLWQDGVTTGVRTILSAGWYSVAVMWNGCVATDTLSVENLPGPLQDTIFGTASVCPFAVGIEYSVEPVPASAYQWFVEGGTISSLSENSIDVDWHDTNASAAVKALITDAAGCKSDTLVYPVRVNVVLLPRMPQGPDTLCVNKSQQVAYTTPETNGSVYQWNISGGIITAGQGTGHVIVDWSKGLNRLWIEETSVTIDTVCQGTSPELSVLVFQDTTALSLNFVSVDTADSGLIHIDWNVEHAGARPGNELLLRKKAQDAADWQLLAQLPVNAGSFPDRPDFSADAVFEYYLALTNSCDEPLVTPVHNNMYLTGQADTVTDIITLTWNHYFGWPQGPDHYEVWRKTDGRGGYRFLAGVAADQNMYAAKASDAFDHQYIVRATTNGNQYESWSTPLSFSFEHAVKIPNVITPNGDGFNQYFEISKIELYANSELTIMDRWGKEVFHATHYQNTWDGGGLSPGVYFYVLDLKRGGKVYKGTLTVF